MRAPAWIGDEGSWHRYLRDVASWAEWRSYPHAFSERLAGIGGRATVVAWAVLEEGEASTQDLHDMGYSHPPRAKQDLQQHGITVVKRMVVNEAT